MHKRTREPQSLGPLLKQLLKKYRPAVAADPSARLRDLNTQWQQAVGSDLSELTRVVTYKGGVLTVEVATAPLVAELQGFARASLIQEMETRGLQGIHDIRFRMAPGMARTVRKETSEEIPARRDPGRG